MNVLGLHGIIQINRNTFLQLKFLRTELLVIEDKRNTFSTPQKTDKCITFIQMLALI